MDDSDHIEHYRTDAETFNYQQPPDSPTGLIERRRAGFIRRLLGKEILQPGARILDVGAGGGILLMELARAGIRPIGLDIAHLNLKKISDLIKREAKPSCHLVNGDAYSLPFGSGALDAVIFSEVLEHLEKPRDALSEAARVLKKGGKLVITVPYREKIVYHLCIHCNRLTPSNAHLHSFDETAMDKLLEDLPFSVIKRTYFHNKLLHLLGIPHRLRSLPHIFWHWPDRAVNLITRKPFYYALAARKEGDDSG